MTNCNSNIVSILHQRAIEHGDRLAYVFLKDGITIGSSFTYKELDRKARAIATALQSQADRAERALLLYSSSEEFLPAFFGCLYANIIAVPTPAIDAVRLKRSLPRLKAIATDSQATIILTTSKLAEGIEEVYTQIPQLRSAQLFVSDAIDINNFSEEFDLITHSKDLAYLQYTSGSTSQPKGVMISHENAIDNLAYITKAHGYDETSISATWTPFFHDYGLVNGLLLPIYAAIPGYVLSPISFIKKPLNWLKAISHYRVTHSGAPNFAYDYCVDRIKKQADLDLSSWRVAHTGAETIRRQTLEKFAQTFESCGFDRNAFYPSYGLAEATLMVTTRSRSDSPVFLTVAADRLAQNKVEISQEHEKTQVLTGCGYPTGNTQVIIVDPQTLTPCAADEVGEIWVSSKSVAQGYWNRPEETQQTFCGDLENFADVSFLRTGDLGFINNGQLFVTGRYKDLIIIKGKNYYPQDIEFTVEQSYPLLRVNSSAVFSIDIEGIEELVVVAEIDSRGDKHLDRDTVFTAISNAIAQEHQLSLHSIVLLKRGSIPKTSSGKIQRHACRQGFIDRSLESIAVWNLETAKRAIVIPENEAEFRLQQIWQEVLNLDAVSIHDNFFELGGDSLLAANVLNKVESRFGQTLPISALSSAPTIKQFARCLHKPDWMCQRCLVPIKPQGNKRSLFFVHPRSGSVMLFGNLARYLDPDRPFYGLQAAGLNGGEPHTSVEAMAAHYIKEIQTVQPEGPYLLGGRCFGGTVAFEMAQQLTAQGHEVASLILIESPLSGMTDRTLAKKIRQNIKKMREMSVSQASNFQQVMNANVQAYKNYHHKAYPGSLIYICAENHWHDPSYGFGWARVVAGKLAVHRVPGNHMNIDEEPNVRFLASKISDCLNESHNSIEQNDRYSNYNIAHNEQPHLYELVKHITKRTQIETIIQIGGSEAQLQQFAPNIKIVRIDGQLNQIADDLSEPEVKITEVVSSDKIVVNEALLQNAIVICADAISAMSLASNEASQLINTLKQWSNICKYLLISSPARDKIRALSSLKSGDVIARELTLDELCHYFTSYNLPIGFYGYTIDDDYHAGKTTSLIISGKEAVCLAPKKVIVTAIINCYNEADIITEVILYLLQQNLNVIVVDNWSTDGSYETVLSLAKKHPKLKVTRFPDAPSSYFNLNEQLINTVKISEQHGHGWYIHYDADEIRESPWQNINLQDAVSFVDSLGYNAIDFTLLNFRYLKGDSDYSDIPPTKRLRYCEFGDRPEDFRQTKAWKYYGQKVNLNKSGGHRVKFANQKIYPFNFLTRHYPLRSPEQSYQKLYRDRLPRLDVEKKFGWHRHYNNLTTEQLKGWDRKYLFPWCPTTFNTEYLIERISRVGISPAKLPKSTKAFVKTICILGMHRSGTSCLAGSLQAAGVSGGAIVEYADDNLLGNRENQSVVDLNKKILIHNKGAWDCPPENISFVSKHQLEMDRLIDLFEDKFPLWMFKDPRTVMTLSFWQENIPNLQLIGTFRHPFKVAMSLYQRQGNSIPLRQGIELWIHYNSLILKEFDRAAFPLICFDLPREKYLHDLTKIVDYLNSKIPQYCQLSVSQLKEFYESNLVHQENITISSTTQEDAELLERAETIYRQLRVRSGLQAVEDTTTALVVPLENDRTLYLKAIELQPERSELYFMLANIEYNSGNIEAATAASKQAFELNSNSINIAEQLSKLLIETDQIDEAVILVEQLVEYQPNNPRIYLLLAEIQQQKDLPAAIYTYQKIIDLIPHHFASRLNIANLLMQDNRVDAAIKHYQQALKLRPKSHQIYSNLGKAYFQQKNWQQAVNSYQKAIELNGNAPVKVYLHLAKAYKQQGNKRQTVETYRKAIASHPNSVHGYIGLGNYYRQQKKWSKAIENYQKAISLNCKNAGVYFALGECWRQKRNWTKAIDSYQEALNLDYHKSFELYKVIGDTLTELNEINSAISAYQKAMKINPDSSEVKNSLHAVDRKLNCI